MLQIEVPSSVEKIGALVQQAIVSGESISLMNNGVAVADIIARQVSLNSQEKRKEALDSIAAMRARTQKMGIDEIITLKHEGHAY
jgi:antitoxin (DNA-binding transcriptional repressor) of toxin-antitoxin stability system